MTGGGTWGSWMDIPGTQTAYTVTGLVNGVEYLFQVRAVRDGRGRGHRRIRRRQRRNRRRRDWGTSLDAVTLSVGETSNVSLGVGVHGNGTGVCDAASTSDAG